MTAAPDHTRYTLSQRLLHWLIAVLVLITLAVGMTIGWLGFDGMQATFGRSGTDLFYTFHKTFGILILMLMLLRVVLRLTHGKPAYTDPLPPLQRFASSTVHTLLYIMLFVQPVLGWLATASGGYPVQFFAANLPGLIGENRALSETLFLWHGVAGLIILGLVTLHIAGALFHWLIRRDGVMRRMSLFR